MNVFLYSVICVYLLFASYRSIKMSHFQLSLHVLHILCCSLIFPYTVQYVRSQTCKAIPYYICNMEPVVQWLSMLHFCHICISQIVMLHIMLLIFLLTLYHIFYDWAICCVTFNCLYVHYYKSNGQSSHWKPFYICIILAYISLRVGFNVSIQC